MIDVAMEISAKLKEDQLQLKNIKVGGVSIADTIVFRYIRMNNGVFGHETGQRVAEGEEMIGILKKL